MSLPENWRESDLSWRWSMKSARPIPPIYGDDLTAAERREFGLTAKQLAFRQGAFLTADARQAGLRSGDVILGINDERLELSAARFDIHIRLNFKPGDPIRVNLLREGRRFDATMTLR